MAYLIDEVALEVWEQKHSKCEAIKARAAFRTKLIPRNTRANLHSAIASAVVPCMKSPHAQPCIGYISGRLINPNASGFSPNDSSKDGHRQSSTTNHATCALEQATSGLRDVGPNVVSVTASIAVRCNSPTMTPHAQPFIEYSSGCLISGVVASKRKSVVQRTSKDASALTREGGARNQSVRSFGGHQRCQAASAELAPQARPRPPSTRAFSEVPAVAPIPRRRAGPPSRAAVRVEVCSSHESHARHRDTRTHTSIPAPVD